MMSDYCHGFAVEVDVFGVRARSLFLLKKKSTNKHLSLFLHLHYPWVQKAEPGSLALNEGWRRLHLGLKRAPRHLLIFPLTQNLLSLLLTLLLLILDVEDNK